MKKWYVYKITFRDGSVYYGYRGHPHPAEDFLIRYFSSSKVVKAKISQGDQYEGQILEIFNVQEEAYQYEQNTIFESIDDPNLLNQVCYKDRKGFGILSPKAKARISNELKIRWQSQSYRERLSKSQSKSWTDERKLKQIERLSGQLRPEHSKKMSGRRLSKSHVEKLKQPKPKGFGERVSAALKGRVKTPEHKQKISESAKNRQRQMCNGCGREYLAVHTRYHSNC